jgi:hypothetical protein
MNNKQLFKEAIADAKAVKEAAIANAKAALEEAFTPYLKEKLAKKLESLDEEVEEGEVTEMKKEIEEMYGKDEAEETVSEEYDDTMEESDSIEELNLDELLAELELDEADESVEEEVEETINEAEEEAEETEEDEEIDIENMDEEKLKKMIEDLIGDMIESGELEAGENYEGEEEAGEEEMEDEEEKMEDEEEITESEIDELLAELAGKDKEDKKKDKMEEELEEAVSVINTLRTELTEVKLLNAKLLYTNKIFKARNLNESQKVKVLSTFDKASTIKEVELVYETLANSFTSAKKEVVKESLGFASKPTGTPQKQTIVEEDAMVKRFKKLAGLI